MRITRAAIEDAHRMYRVLRPEDKLEIKAGGHTPKAALVEGVKRSRRCWTIFKDGKPVCMFGVVDNPELEGSGFVWMLGTRELPSLRRVLVRHGKGVLEALADGYWHLCNWCHAENIVHLRWIDWLGFEFLKRVPHNGHVFITFQQTFLHVRPSPGCSSGS